MLVICPRERWVLLMYLISTSLYAEFDEFNDRQLIPLSRETPMQLPANCLCHHMQLSALTEFSAYC
jgi:hypothetical protein